MWVRHGMHCYISFSEIFNLYFSGLLCHSFAFCFKVNTYRTFLNIIIVGKPSGSHCVFDIPNHTLAKPTRLSMQRAVVFKFDATEHKTRS